MRFTLINQPMFNRGDESAHKALVYALLQHFPDCTIEVLFTGRPQEAVDECKVGDVRVTYTNLQVTRRYLLTYLSNLRRGTFLLWRFNPVVRRIIRCYRKSDWIISSPGNRSLGPRYDWDHLFFVTLAEYVGCKVAYYGRSIGPFVGDNPLKKRFDYLAVKALRKASFVSLRDPESIQIASEIGVKAHSTLDTAFLYTPMVQAPQDVRDFVGDDRYFVLVPNYLIPEAKDFKGRSTPTQVKYFFSELARRMLAEFPEHKILMLPQLFCGHDYQSSDHAFFVDIEKEVDDSRLCVLPDTLLSEQHQAIISGSSGVVGARYHSIVFAINNNVPFVTLNYGGRIRGMLELLGKQDCVVDITQALEPPRGRKPLPEAKPGEQAPDALTFDGEVALARILDKMHHLQSDDGARRLAKAKTSECFYHLVEAIKGGKA